MCIPLRIKKSKCCDHFRSKWWGGIFQLPCCICMTSVLKTNWKTGDNRLIYYINENKLLYKCQFGFQTGKSTYMALIDLLDKISEALGINMVSRAWLYIGFRIMYTIENNMLPITPTNIIMNQSNVVSPKAPFLGHCSFYCISKIYLICRWHQYVYNMDAMSMKCVINWILTCSESKNGYTMIY